jgi:hypothetical protein
MGVLVEHLIEVAHPEEENAVWVGLFKPSILTHCRRITWVLRLGLLAR